MSSLLLNLLSYSSIVPNLLLRPPQSFVLKSKKDLLALMEDSVFNRSRKKTDQLHQLKVFTNSIFLRQYKKLTLELAFYIDFRIKLQLNVVKIIIRFW